MSNRDAPSNANGFVVAGRPGEEARELREILLLDPAARQPALSSYLERTKREAEESSRREVQALLKP